jgi:hypothetical protein
VEPEHEIPTPGRRRLQRLGHCNGGAEEVHRTVLEEVHHTSLQEAAHKTRASAGHTAVVSPDAGAVLVVHRPPDAGAVLVVHIPTQRKIDTAPLEHLVLKQTYDHTSNHRTQLHHSLPVKFHRLGQHPRPNLHPPRPARIRPD